MACTLVPAVIDVTLPVRVSATLVSVGVVPDTLADTVTLGVNPKLVA